MPLATRWESCFGETGFGAAALHELAMERRGRQDRRAADDSAARRPRGRRGPALRRRGTNRFGVAGRRRRQTDGVSQPAVRRRHQLCRAGLGGWIAVGELLFLTRRQGLHLPGEGENSGQTFLTFVLIVCVLHRLILFLAKANGQERKRAIVCFPSWELRFCRE